MQAGKEPTQNASSDSPAEPGSELNVDASDVLLSGDQVAGSEAPSASEAPAKSDVVSSGDPLKVLEKYYRKDNYLTTKILIGINCLVFALMVVSSNGSALVYAGRDVVVRWGATSPSLALNEEPWRLLTSAFVHVGVLHLLVNMFVLWDVGRYIERLGGTIRFLTIYIFCAIGASLFSLLAHPYQVSAGASGAVLGLWGAFLSFFINNQSTLPKRLVISTMRFVPVFVFIAVVTGTFIPDVDNAAHAGGFIVGAFCGIFLLRPASRPVPIAVTVSSLLAVAGLLFTLFRVDQMRPFDYEHRYEYERAIDLINRHDAKQALAMLNKHIATNPTASDGYVMRAHINEKMENWPGAEADATKILELGGPAHVAYSLRAQARLNKGDYQNAIADAQEAIKLAPTLVPPYTVKIQAKEWLGKYDEAIADATAINAPALSEAGLHRLRGEINWQKGDYAKARQEFDQSVEKSRAGTHSPEIALASRSQFLLSLRDYQQAAADAEQAFSLTGAESSHAAYNATVAALAYRGAGNEPRAQEILQKVGKHIRDPWQQKLVSFVSGKMSAAELLAAAQNVDEQTEADTYVAVEYLRLGKNAEARPLLEWVVEHGNKAFVEYPQAKAMLRGLDGAREPR